MAILKVFVYVTLTFMTLMCLFFCIKHIRAIKNAKFYTSQGLVKLTSFDFPILGSAKTILEYEMLKSSNQLQKPLKPTLLWLVDQHDKSRAEDSYDAAKIPNFIMNLGGDLSLVIADPEIV